MMNIILNGGGRMGTTLASLIDAADDMQVVATVDVDNAASLAALPPADVVIDFSVPAALAGVVDYVRRTGTALVCGTTGLTAEHMAALQALGKDAPVLYAANYSVGIAAMRRALPLLRDALGPDFDIEMTETHHRGKADAPSGTAKLLLAALDPAGECATPAQRHGPRGDKEIGVHALRGGTVAGQHTVHFFGPDETLTLSHAAADRRIFAQGALRAARSLAGRPAGFYTLDEILFEGDDAQ